MNGFGFNSNGFVRHFLDKPIGTYIHNTNPEIVISAVDSATDIFTCVDHGLSDGDTLFPILNYDSGNVFLLSVIAGGLTRNVYYVGVVTKDTFKLYTDSSRAQLVNIIDNVNIDLTKWHFEKSTINTGFTIVNLPVLQKCKLKLTGKCLLSTSGVYIRPTGISIAQEWLQPNYNNYDYPYTRYNGDVFNYGEVIIDGSNILTITLNGVKATSKSSTEITVERITNILFSPKYLNINFNSISVSNLTPANGFKMEVYKA